MNSLINALMKNDWVCFSCIKPQSIFLFHLQACVD